MDVSINEQGIARKNLFSLGLADAVAFLAFSRVAFVPLKAGYLAKINYRCHLGHSSYTERLPDSIPMR